jgi:hypothetical protein
LGLILVEPELVLELVDLMRRSASLSDRSPFVSLPTTFAQYASTHPLSVWRRLSNE